MIAIIVGTNRPESRSLSIAKLAEKEFREIGEKTALIDLKDLDFSTLNGSQYSDNKPKSIGEAIELLHKCSGYFIVAPEYNGSMPGILKYFIDHFEYPRTFEKIPVSFVGLGGRFGGVRPVEHLQQVFNYRNAFVYPERLFLMNVWDLLKDDELDESHSLLLKKQVSGFSKYIKALLESGLHPRS